MSAGGQCIQTHTNERFAHRLFLRILNFDFVITCCYIVVWFIGYRKFDIHETYWISKVLQYMYCASTHMCNWEERQTDTNDAWWFELWYWYDCTAHSIAHWIRGVRVSLLWVVHAVCIERRTHCYFFALAVCRFNFGS